MKKQQKRTRIFSLLLCLMMVLGMLPVVANAALDVNSEVAVLKTDGDGNPLAGAKFVLLGTGNYEGQDYEAFSGEDGIATFTDVEDGEYYLKEETAPEGYFISYDSYEIVTDNGDVYFKSEEATTVFGEPYEVVVFINEKIPTYQFTVEKTDSLGNPLAGATFVLTGTGNSIGKSFEAVSGEDGIATFDVPEGFYTLSEQEAPEGYVKADDSYEIAIWNGTVHFYDEDAQDEQATAYEQVTFVNEKKAEDTSDSSNMFLWGALILASGLGVFGTMLYTRKYRISAK